MKLSIDTCFLQENYGDFKTFSLIKEAGFDGVDYSFYWMQKRPEILNKEGLDYARQLRAELDRLGLVCHQAHAPFGLKYADPFDLSHEPYRDVVRSMELASVLGAKHIVVHSICSPDKTEELGYSVMLYKSLEPYCRQFGIKIAIENLFNAHDWHVAHLGTPDELKMVLTALDPQCFTVCVDVGHAQLTGNPPQQLIAGLNKDILGGLHIQDVDALGDRHTLPYLGNIDWDAVTAALKQIDYQGDFTLEIFGYQRCFCEELMPQALALAAQTGRSLIKKITQ